VIAGLKYVSDEDGMSAFIAPVEDLKPLTSLRFVAASMIVLLHSLLYFKWHWLTYVPQTAVQGVSFFFVLSGFILTHAYHARKFTYFGFVRARIARLWPVHLVMLALVLVFLAPRSQSFDGPGLFSKWWTFGANAFLLQSAVPYLSYYLSWNSVSWSISTEMFFYLTFPFLLKNIYKTWHWKLLASLLAVGGIILVTQVLALPLTEVPFEVTALSLLYAFPISRLFDFSLGMAAYVAWLQLSKLSITRWQATLIEATVLLFAVYWLTRGYLILYPYLSLPVLAHMYGQSGTCWLFAIVIIAVAGSRGYIGKALSIPPFIWLGEISFALYMVHQVTMKLIAWNFPAYKTPWIVYGVCIGGAALLHHGVEKPMRKLLLKKRRVLDQPPSSGHPVVA
jgi:peptidoglycan/LPS O-acetylase OafA/YrhL